jgi:hypothetical protein
LPFDNARLFDVEAVTGPDCAGLEAAIGRFDCPHPYLLFRSGSMKEIRRSLAELRRRGGERLSARWAELLSPAPAPAAAAELRSAIKRRARRLINTAFIAIAGERALAEPALAVTRSLLAEFAAMPSWKERPVIRSFLDCAEIAVAVALAYDWLFDALAGEERQEIENAIRRNVLEPALAAYQDPTLLWPRRRDNCTIVSNAGILIAALSVVPLQRAPAAELLRHSLVSSWNVLDGLAPDGAWREGLSYWALAMRYAGLMVAALESAFGASFGLAERPGFACTGDFALHAAGPFGAAFNFGDSEPNFDPAALAWFAYRYRRPVDAWLRGDPEGWHLPFAAIWPSPAKASPATLGLPTGKVFHSADLACFRSTWSTEAGARAAYLAIKGGNVAARIGARVPRPEDILFHAQADAGTFVVDGARQRWVVDMGADDYDLPQYFDHGDDGRSGLRWRYYRAQAAGHNTLTIGGRGQLPNSPATIVGSSVEGDNKWVVLDLSLAYGEPPGAVRRGAALLGHEVVIQDEIGAQVRGAITWTLHTAAEPVALTGSIARFRLGDDQFAARILEPAGAQFELSYPPPPRAFSPAPPDQRHGRAADDMRPVSELPRRTDHAGRRAAGAPIRRLQIVVPAGTPRITVLLLPDCDGSELGLPVMPLDHWLARRPVRLTGVPRRGCRARGLTANRAAPRCSKVGAIETALQSAGTTDRF